MIQLAGRAGRVLGRAAVWTVVAAMAVALLAAVVVPRVAGGTPYAVLTGSMRPNLPPGTLVVTRPADADDIGVGSVITYQLRTGQPEVVTHRVVAVGQGPDGAPRWRTRGDANGAADPGWVRPEQVRGELWYAVPVLGRATVLLTATQRRLLETAAALGLLGYAVVRFGGAVRDRTRRPARHAAVPT